MTAAQDLTLHPDVPDGSDAPSSALAVVADDDADIRHLVAWQLRRSGYEVVEAGDGRAAIEACRRPGVAIAILDISMPEADGFEVLATLKADKATRSLPVILLTAGMVPDGLAKALGLGAHDYLRKPFDIDELQARVDAAVQIGRRNNLLDRAVSSLAESEERWRTAFDAAPVGMAQLTPTGALLRVNPALPALLGYTADELQGRVITDLMHPDDAERAAGAIRSLAEGEIVRHAAEERFIHARGHQLWVNVNAAAVVGSNGVVDHVIAHYVDVTDRKRFERQLQHMADHDPLTGLRNRRSFEAELERHVAHAARYGPAGALLVLDLDDFKQVNDTLGHNAGDELIVSIADVLRRRLRDTDILARLGGDEFAVILPHADQAEAELVAAAVVAAVSSEVTILSNGQTRRISTSVGVAMFDGQGLTGEEMLVNADLTMYDAKDAGRNRYAVYQREHDAPDRTRARLAWVDRIDRALEEDRFTLLAQPILDLQTHTVGRHELLLRMVGEDGDLIPPATFLYVAERTGMVSRIDRWVADRAITLAAEHGERLGTLEVNLSGLSMGDAELLAFIEQRITDSGADPGRLVFEITETAAVANIHLAREFAHRLSNIGCSFALDDFGAGFGSFYYLKHLPFHYLKIDGEFIAKCLNSPTDQLIIKALVDIAQGLEKQTIAEFVGDEATLRFLQRAGVDHAQGFHIGTPVPIEAVLGSATQASPGDAGPTAGRAPLGGPGWRC